MVLQLWKSHYQKIIMRPKKFPRDPRGSHTSLSVPKIYCGLLGPIYVTRSCKKTPVSCKKIVLIEFCIYLQTWTANTFNQSHVTHSSHVNMIHDLMTRENWSVISSIFFAKHFKSGGVFIRDNGLITLRTGWTISLQTCDGSFSRNLNHFVS